VTASFAVLGWRYDATLLIQCVLVWLGVSLVAHAIDEPATPPIATNPR